MKFATQAIHVGQAPDPASGATVPPISLSSTFTQAAPGEHKGFEYARSGNPTRQNLEACLAALEGGTAAAAFASGLAASTAILHAHVRPGESVVAYSDLYGGTYRLFERVFKPWGLVPRYTDSTDPAEIAALVDGTTRIVWIESPTNPMLKLLDIAAVARAARAKAAGGRLLLVVDNTFATPALQRPLELGADLALHSTTKYMGGHSDVIGGAVIVKDAAVMEPIRFHQNAAGAVPGPFDCYLTHRGLKTLALRMRQHSENAQRVAEWLTEQCGRGKRGGPPGVEQVIYPGLESHPHYDLAARQMAAFGGMVSCVLRGGVEGVRRFMSRLRIFACAESLGGVESLANYPAIMTHASMPRELRERIGIVDGLVRLSVGIEDVDDLIADLQQALGE